MYTVHHQCSSLYSCFIYIYFIFTFVAENYHTVEWKYGGFPHKKTNVINVRTVYAIHFLLKIRYPSTMQYAIYYSMRKMAFKFHLFPVVKIIFIRWKLAHWRVKINFQTQIFWINFQNLREQYVPSKRDIFKISSICSLIHCPASSIFYLSSNSS